MSHTVYLGLGANLGDRAENLRNGLRRLAPDVRVIAVSSLYESLPVGFTQQGPFLNAVCAAETDLDSAGLLLRVKQTERELGRVPGRRWGPRPLDLDILLYDRSTVDLPDLQIPHPRMIEREFVLRPLLELAPELVVPGTGRAVAALLGMLADQGVRCVQGPEWAREEPPL
jgi:2-amino-4-hydroxy-6-hydroxymethyldihydropteridine diphosphokinase